MMPMLLVHRPITGTNSMKKCSQRLYYLSSTSSGFYAYFAGGLNTGGPANAISTITRLDFINETISNANINLSSIRRMNFSSTSNKLNYLESQIKEFNMKKFDLENIYKLSINEKDLISKLSARRFINKVSSK